jgi:hypothetical protein
MITVMALALCRVQRPFGLHAIDAEDRGNFLFKRWPSFNVEFISPFQKIQVTDAA